MWVPSSLLDLFQISRQTVDYQREELAAIRSERDTLKTQLVATQANFAWLTTRVNALEVERAQLIKKAYNIDMPVPEIIRPAQRALDINADLFEDMGEDRAKEFGFPQYNN